MIRVSGPGALLGVGQALRFKRGGNLSAADQDRLRYGRFVQGAEVVDDVIVSYAHLGGTPVVDLSAHGGVRVVERILQTLDRLGFPLASAGESPGAAWPTESLIECETVGAMARAKTGRSVRFLTWQHRHLVGCLEAVVATSQSDSQRAWQMLEAMMVRYRSASLLIEGASIAIVGAPNSGKSTLFNRLVGRSAAIVSRSAGTTRDWLAQGIEVDGVPLTLVDTAGRRACTDELEQTSVEAGCRMAERADLCLLLLDGSVPLSPHDSAWWGELRLSSRPLIVVCTKLDLGSVWDDLPPPRGFAGPQPPLVRVSALSDAGIDELLRKILGLLGCDERVDNLPCLFTERQVGAARQVQAALGHGREALQGMIQDRLISGRPYDSSE